MCFLGFLAPEPATTSRYWALQRGRLATLDVLGFFFLSPWKNRWNHRSFILWVSGCKLSHVSFFFCLQIVYSNCSSPQMWVDFFRRFHPMDFKDLSRFHEAPRCFRGKSYWKVCKSWGKGVLLWTIFFHKLFVLLRRCLLEFFLWPKKSIRLYG